jgi:L-aminopeptidase/D-esterase-like protein
VEARRVIGCVPGVAVGHWTDPEARTGCTAVLFEGGAVASGEVRGGAPATREFELLDPLRLVDRVDAVMLCGGSAFGLAACDGAMGFLEERGQGFPTSAGPVPIVVGMALFDLDVGSAAVRPGAAEGRIACSAAASGWDGGGNVGAGTGATVGRAGGEAARRPGGIGGGVRRSDELVVGALAAVNAVGDVRGRAEGAGPGGSLLESTTLVVVATTARLTKGECRRVAEAAHVGLARAIEPAHTAFDGDAAVAASVGSVEAEVEAVRVLAAGAVEDAVRDGVRG